VLKLIEPMAGRIRLGGVDVTGVSPGAMWEHRRRVQIVFQDPYFSLNPRPLRRHHCRRATGELPSGHEPREASAGSVPLVRVGVEAESLQRHPQEFSGGQRRRLGIAKALSVIPDQCATG
jgi:peptide/nickel transport system ATP-binding protein/oligopeptide transport system ATP-binding protein